MDLSYGNQRFAEFSSDVSITGQAGIGLHRIIFTFKLNVHPREHGRQVDVLDLHGELRAGDRHVGPLAPLGRVAFGTALGPINDISQAFVLDLDARRLDRLNDALASKPIGFQVDLHGLARGSSGLEQIWTSGHVTSSREHWVAALQQAGFARTLTTEIVVPESGDERLKKGVEALAKALQLRFGDEARVAVGHCRVAMDEAGLDKSGLNVNLGKKLEDLTFDERVKLVRFALFAFCSPPQHSLTADYLEDEARLASGLAALLLEYEARKRKP